MIIPYLSSSYSLFFFFFYLIRCSQKKFLQNHIKLIIKIVLSISLYKFTKIMIQCSPQQVIAQALNNCYSFRASYLEFNGLKKANRKNETPYSPRNVNKKSLKRCLSANVFPQIIDEASRNQVTSPSIKILTPILHYQQNRKIEQNRLIENRKYQANLCNYKQMSTRNALEKIRLFNQVKEVLQMPQINKDKVRCSTIQTFCSLTDTQKLYSNQLTFTNEKIEKRRIKVKVANPLIREQKKADRKQVEGKTTKLNSLNPKLTESLVSSSNTCQDQYSEVVNSFINYRH